MNLTTNVTDIIPGLNLLPINWRPFVITAFALSPYVTRAIYALTHNGGIKGIISAIWLGTNSPKQQQQNETKP